MKKIVPDLEQMRRYLDQGMSQRAIAEKYEEDTGIRVSRSAIAMAIERYGLTSAKPRPRYMDTVPWKIAPEHRDHNDLRMLRLEARRRRGESLPEKELRLVTNFLDLLRDRDAVITYDPRTKRGFWWVERSEGDTDIVRRPQ